MLYEMPKNKVHQRVLALSYQQKYRPGPTVRSIDHRIRLFRRSLRPRPRHTDLRLRASRQRTVVNFIQTHISYWVLLLTRAVQPVGLFAR
jgi:hypothetical protein